MSVLGAVLYFGWPIIEAILIVLPIPDPSHINTYVIQCLEFLQNLPSKLSGGSAEGSDIGKMKK